MLQAAHRAATSAEVDAALAQLDHQAGMYFGVDAGIAGLHPLQATLVDAPALVIGVAGNGLDVRSVAPLGAALLAQPALQAWADASRPDAGRHPVQSLRALLALFEPASGLFLLGALRFNAHLLAQAKPPPVPIGVMFLPASCWRRDGTAQWQHVAWSLSDQAKGGALQGAPFAAPHAPEPEPRAPDDAGAVRDDHPPGGHAAMVARALAHLHAQPLVSLTLSQSFRRRTDRSAAQAFARLRAVNPAPATFFVHDGHGSRLFGASPDLQLVIERDVVRTLPVCGTVARGPGPVGEADAFHALLNEPVDAASLAVCSDALRNDLAPLCVPGSLHLAARRRQMSLATVVHTVDLIEGRLRDGVDAWDAVVATAAPAMVTGAPRALALAAIDQLEASPRGWYGGLAIQIGADGHALVGTLLRAAELRNGIAEVRTGGDLLADSVPEREEQESRLKALSLWRALGLDTPDAAGPGAAAAAEPGAADMHSAPRNVRLLDTGDPFPGAVRDMLAGLGVVVDANAPLTVFTGSTSPPAHLRCAVAMGDAAARVLADAGMAVQAITPEQGRLLTCHATMQAPWGAVPPWHAARYATLALAPSAHVPVGWTVWARDGHGQPVVLADADRRLVCLLFRPDSLMSGPFMSRMLRIVMGWCQGGASAEAGQAVTPPPTATAT